MPLQVGERVKELRVQRGLTVGALAELTGLSKGLISQVENEKTSPSLSTLERLAEGLGVTVASLLLKPEDGLRVVRYHERSTQSFSTGESDIRVEMLSSRLPSSLKAVIIELQPGVSTGCEPHTHAGEEFHLVLEGQIQVESGCHRVVLDPGDACQWKSCTPHRLANVGEGVARLLAVTSSSVDELVSK